MADEGDVTSEIKLAFAALDQDGDSTLSKEEIADLIRNLSNRSPSAVQIQRLFDWFETPITGKIPLNTLVRKIKMWIGDDSSTPRARSGSSSPGSPRFVRKREAVQHSIRKFFVDFLSGSMSCLNRDPAKIQARLAGLGNDVETSLGSISNYHSMSENCAKITAQAKLNYANDCWKAYKGSKDLVDVLKPLSSNDPRVLINALKKLQKFTEIKKALRSPEERYEVMDVVFHIFNTIYVSNVVTRLKSFLRPDWLGLVEDLNPADQAQKFEVQYLVLSILADFVGGPNFSHMQPNDLFHPRHLRCFKQLLNNLEDKCLFGWVFRLMESSPNVSVRGAACRLIGAIGEQGFETANHVVIALHMYLQSMDLTDDDVVSKLSPLLTGLNDIHQTYVSKIVPQIQLVRERRLQVNQIERPPLSKQYVIFLRAQTWALSQICVSATSGPNWQQLLKEFLPRACCKGNTKMLQLLLFILQQLNSYKMVTWLSDAYVTVNCINALACFAPAVELFWSVPGMKGDLLNLLVIAMMRTWETARQCNLVIEACLWCFEKMLLALPPQSNQAKLFSVALLKNTGYVRQLVNLMATLEEDEDKGLTQAMVTSLQRGALINFRLLLRNEVALNALAKSTDFVKGLTSVLLDNDASSAQHAAVAAEMFHDIALKGSVDVRAHLLKCGVGGALFRSLDNFKQTDKLLAETYGASYGTKYNVPLAMHVFRTLRVMLLGGDQSGGKSTLRYIGMDQMNMLNRFMDVLIQGIADNQLDKWRITFKKEDGTVSKPIEKEAVQMYLDLLNAHQGSGDSMSQRICFEGRQKVQAFTLKIGNAKMHQQQVKQRRQQVARTSNAGVKVVTNERGEKILLVDLEWGTAKSCQLQVPLNISLQMLLVEAQRKTGGVVSLKFYGPSGWSPIRDDYVWAEVKKNAMAGKAIRLRADFGSQGSMYSFNGAVGGSMMNAGVGGGGMMSPMAGGQGSWITQRAQSVGQMAQMLARHNIRLDLAQLSAMRMTLRQVCPTGRIDISQRDTVFKSCLRRAGIPVDARPKIVQALWRQFDFDKNNYIDESEFVVGLSMLTRGTPKQKLEQIFDAFDKNNDGTLDGRELAELFQAMTNQNFGWCQQITNQMLRGRRFMNKNQFAEFMQMAPLCEANRWWHQMRMSGMSNMYNAAGSMGMPVGVTTMGLMDPVGTMGPIGGGMAPIPMGNVGMGGMYGNTMLGAGNPVIAGAMGMGGMGMGMGVGMPRRNMAADLAW